MTSISHPSDGLRSKVDVDVIHGRSLAHGLRTTRSLDATSLNATVAAIGEGVSHQQSVLPMKALLQALCSLSVVLTLAIPMTTARAGWLDQVVKPSKTSPSTTPSPSTGGVDQSELIGGLKEALSKGVQQAVGQLGKEGGFLKNPNVRIPMPENLQYVERGLRTAGQTKLADDFVATINHAAEKAVPEAAGIFADSLSKMSVADARGILTGPSDAATQYFRKSSETRLNEKFLPIVKNATEQVGVTAAYKNLMAKAGPAAQLLGSDAGDLDAYVTRKSLDGLFKVIAAEEKRIRENPAARTTDLLKKVFGQR